jgi:hypothetical protein
MIGCNVATFTAASSGITPDPSITIAHKKRFIFK